MADLSVNNNVQILPPLKNNTVPVRKGPPRFVPNASQSVQTSGNQTGSVNTGVNIAKGAGLALYDTVNTAMAGRQEKSTGAQMPPPLGSIVDIKV